MDDLAKLESLLVLLRKHGVAAYVGKNCSISFAAELELPTDTAEDMPAAAEVATDFDDDGASEDELVAVPAVHSAPPAPADWAGGLSERVRAALPPEYMSDALWARPE